MKKIIFGFVLCGSFISTISKVNGQASVDPGEGSKWVCCQVQYEAYCTDMYGGAWANSIRVPGQTCS